MRQGDSDRDITAAKVMGRPKATQWRRLATEQGCLDAAQPLDFGAGSMLIHPDGRPRRTWAFVMTLAHSRHQYVEFVWDQSSATWLGCHRRSLRVVRRRA